MKHLTKHRDRASTDLKTQNPNTEEEIFNIQIFTVKLW